MYISGIQLIQRNIFTGHKRNPVPLIIVLKAIYVVLSLMYFTLISSLKLIGVYYYYLHSTDCESAGLVCSSFDHINLNGGSTLNLRQ